MKLNSQKLKELNFWEIIKESFVLAWQKKYLWWFGLFLILGGSSSFGFSSDDSKRDSSMKAFNTFFAQHPAFTISIISFLIVLCILLFILSFFARGALIKSIHQELAEKKSNFKAGLKMGKKYFGKILGLTLLSVIFLIAVAIVMAIPITSLFAAKAFIPAFILIAIAILIFIPLAFLVHFLLRLGYLYLVLGDLSIRSALENAYSLLKNNLAANLIFFLIFLLVNFVFCIALFFLLAPVALILFLVGLILFFIFQKIGIVIAIILAVLILLPIFLIIVSFYQVFQQTAWIKFFHAIAKPKIEEKVLEKIPETKKITATNAVEEI